MSDAQLTKEIREFLIRYAISVGHLEILIFLYNGRSRAWTVQELSQKMRTNLSMVERHLYDLRDLTQDLGEAGMRFNVQDPQLLDCVARTAELYLTHKHAVINEIYSVSLGAIRSFADAFKIKKDQE